MNNHNLFAYGYSESSLLPHIDAVLYGYELWARGYPSIKRAEGKEVRGWFHQLPPDMIDYADIQSAKFGEYHRFKVKVFLPQLYQYVECWTYQMVEDADEVTRATSYTLEVEEVAV